MLCLLFCFAVLCILSSFAIISLGMRGLVTLHELSSDVFDSWCSMAFVSLLSFFDSSFAMGWV